MSKKHNPQCAKAVGFYGATVEHAPKAYRTQPDLSGPVIRRRKSCPKTRDLTGSKQKRGRSYRKAQGMHAELCALLEPTIKRGKGRRWAENRAKKGKKS